MEVKKYVVAIDFGISHFKFGYTYIGDQMNEVYGLDKRKCKIDSTILLLRDKKGLQTDFNDGVRLIKCVGFGSEAEEKYNNSYQIDLELSNSESEEKEEIEESEESEESKEKEEQEENEGENESKVYPYNRLELFRFYKMRISQKKSTCISEKGNHFLIHQVLSFALRYVSELEIKQICKHVLHKNFSMKHIFWVLTRPAFWKEETKHFMRKCAKKAGIIDKTDSKSLVVITEPEAAAIEYIFVNTSRGIETKKEKILIFEAKSFMINLTLVQITVLENQTRV
ncbi:alpha kinase/elongation factor 2 kinase [Anaeramoeba flamelloides]|uniref:Alpha kinase/elongation factor 2 kinase n=1 Tax=Anaeramoeba flamelloides TaxID=1746091 RepID=A0ABQ8Z3H7_9EUKA|nr:alpha kinase/elongation factor 2 kinase [Anaeramoeba flamelloides]